MLDLFTFTPAMEQCLRDQAITDDQPGPVLHDFRVVLEYVGTEGVETAGKYNLLPMRSIGELDGRLSRPLHLEAKMKRPQIRSHPYLQGLNLLLRASGLSRVEGVGGKARLVLDPAMMVQWERLNPTERYFNLLEAWLRHGRPEMVGDQASGLSSMFLECTRTWREIAPGGRSPSPKEPSFAYIGRIGRDSYKLALMDLFGLLYVEHPPVPVMPWAPAGVRRVPFGDAVCTRLFGAWISGSRRLLGLEADDEAPAFGAWQPLFQPYFPEWRRNLEYPEPEVREGTYVFRASLGKDIWRRIAIPADSTLDELADWILRSVRFDSDHLYEFVYRDAMGARIRASHPECGEGPWTDEVAIGELPLEPGQSMEFQFDFGDNWRFHVELERIEPPGAKVKAPSILERHGKAPKQYEDGW